MTAESVQMLLALGLGFAFAGLCSSGYRLFTSRLPSFSQLSEGRRFEFVFLATLIAGFWSLMSGLVLVMSLQACGLLHA